MLDSIPTAICRSASQPALVLWIQLAVGLESPNLDNSGTKWSKLSVRPEMFATGCDPKLK